MAIAFDAKAQGQSLNTTTTTFSHTCTGSDRILFVSTGNQGGTTVTGVTYNSVAMTRIGAGDVNCGGNRNISLWYLIAPATGANNVVITRSNTSGWIFGYAFSYTGAKQSGQPDASASGTGSSATITGNVTTVANNCWAVLVAGSSDDGLAASTNSTSIYSNDLEHSAFDTSVYGNITPAGSFSMSATNAGTTEYGYIMASFAPSISAFVPRIMMS